MKTKVYNSLDDISRAATDELLSIVNGAPLSIIVPGGDTPKGFFDLLSKEIVDWKNICLILSDERMVSWNHDDSNYGALKKILLDKISRNNKPKIIPNMEKYNENNIKKFINKTNHSLIKKLPISYAFLGLGTDGHTASLFSGKTMVSMKDEPYFLTMKENEPYKRMTLSIEFLQEISNITFLVSGRSKFEALSIIHGRKEIKNISPSQKLIDHTKGMINIFCDRQALFG